MTLVSILSNKTAIKWLLVMVTVIISCVIFSSVFGLTRKKVCLQKAYSQFTLQVYFTVYNNQSLFKRRFVDTHFNEIPTNLVECGVSAIQFPNTCCTENNLEKGSV